MEKVHEPSTPGSSRDPIQLTRHSIFKSSKELVVCRICLEPELVFEQLRSPCACKGSIKYVHQTCLKKWIQCKLETVSISERNKMLAKGEILCQLCKKMISFQSEVNTRLVSMDQLMKRVPETGTFKLVLFIVFFLLMVALIMICSLKIYRNQDDPLIDFIMYVLISLVTLVLIITFGYLIREMIIQTEYEITDLRQFSRKPPPKICQIFDHKKKEEQMEL